MNPTGVTQDRELIFVRFEQSFPQFVAGLFQWPPLWVSIPLAVLAVVALVATLAVVARRALPGRRRPGQADDLGWWLWWGAFASWVFLGLWALVALFHNDTFPKSAATGDTEATSTSANAAYWLVFVTAVFVLGA